MSNRKPRKQYPILLNDRDKGTNIYRKMFGLLVDTERHQTETWDLGKGKHQDKYGSKTERVLFGFIKWTKRTSVNVYDYNAPEKQNA